MVHSVMTAQLAKQWRAALDQQTTPLEPRRATRRRVVAVRRLRSRATRAS